MDCGEIPPVADHGGGLDRAVAVHGGRRESWLDLSTGINPHAYRLPPIKLAAWRDLPDRLALARLEAAARRAYGAAGDAPVAAVPGSQALIQLLPRLLPPGDVAVLAPCYAEHARCWRLGGHRVREIDAPEAAGLDEILIVVNPNNPDGRRVERAAVLERVRRQGGLTVVDEAFADMDPAASLADEVAPGLLVLRSFGKFYGLAGLRLGFVLGDPAWVGRIKAAFGPWAVSGPALTVAAAALGDLRWAEAMRIRLGREAEALDTLLGEAGFPVIGGTNLFRLARVEGAAALAGHLGRHHILVRSFERYPDWLRFGLPPDAAAGRRLAAVLAAR